METDQLSISSVSAAFVQWAGSHGVISRELVLPEKDEGVNKSDGCEIFLSPPDLFDSHSSRNLSANILRNVNVTLIGYSDVPKEIRVYHRKRILKKDLDQLPKNLKGDIKLSFHYVGEDAVIDDRAAQAAGSVHPAFATNGRFTCGTSIGVGPYQGAGTLGCLVTDSTGDIFGLTNNHVIGASNYAPKNIPVLAPAPVDMFSMRPIEPMCVGEFSKCIQIVYGLPGTVDYSNNLDVALFKVHNISKVSSMQRDHYDTPSSFAQISSDMLVQKVGRSTGLTSGKVIIPSRMRRNIKYKVKEKDFAGEAWFNDIFVVEGTSGKFADLGDSGSLIVAKSPDGNGRVAVGLVFAVQDQLTFAMPITQILNRLNVTLVSGHNL